MGMGFLLMALGVIFTALNSNADVPKESPPASGTSVKPEEITFELIKDIKFADGTEVKSIVKANIDDLRDLPVWMGGSDHIDELRLTHKKKNSTCVLVENMILRWRAAITLIPVSRSKCWCGSNISVDC